MDISPQICKKKNFSTKIVEFLLDSYRAPKISGPALVPVKLFCVLQEDSTRHVLSGWGGFRVQTWSRWLWRCCYTRISVSFYQFIVIMYFLFNAIYSCVSLLIINRQVLIILSCVLVCDNHLILKEIFLWLRTTSLPRFHRVFNHTRAEFNLTIIPRYKNKKSQIHNSFIR